MCMTVTEAYLGPAHACYDPRRHELYLTPGLTGREQDHVARDVLTQQGIPQPRTGRSWTTRGVALTLGNGFAAGLLSVHDPACPCRKPAACLRRVHIDGAHEPLITRAMWDEHVRIRAGRAATPARRLGSPHVLSGLVRCAGCDHAMRVRPQTEYRSQRLECPEPRQCPAPAGTVYARVLDEVLGWLRWVADDVDGAARTAAAADTGQAAARQTAATLARALQRTEDALTRLTTDLARGLIPEGAYIAARDELVADRDRAAAALADAEDALRRPTPDRALVAGLLDGWDVLPVVDRRDLVGGLCRITVTRGRARTGSAEVRVRGAWDD